MIHEFICTFHEELIANIYFIEISKVDGQNFVFINIMLEKCQRSKARRA